MARATQKTGELHRLTQDQCDSAPSDFGLKEDGFPKAIAKLPDGGGLYLQCTPTRIDANGDYGWNKAWVFRFTSPMTGKERIMGLGGSDLSLAAARKAADHARDLVEAGKDPLELKSGQNAPVSRSEPEKPQGIAFRDLAERCLLDMRSGWDSRSGKTEISWRIHLGNYIYPVIAHMQAIEVRRTHVKAIVTKGGLWQSKRTTAERIVRQIHQIIEWGIANELLPETHCNPAIFKRVKIAIGDKSPRETKNHEALPYAQIATLINLLLEKNTSISLCIAFTIVTALRCGESRLTKPSEIEGPLFTVPAARMKGKRGTRKAHEVPLSALALEILERAKALNTIFDGVVFPGGRGSMYIGAHAMNRALQGYCEELGFYRVEDGRKIYPTMHGMRSAFRDFCTDNGLDEMAAELTLAHTVRLSSVSDNPSVVKAYLRTKVMPKRVAIMAAWGEHCTPKAGSIVQLQRKSA
jgi:integrase